MLKETEGGVALAENAGLQKASDAMGEFVSAPVLGNNQAALAEERSGAEEAEDAVVLIFLGVGRIDKNEIEWGVGGLVAGGEFFEGAEGVEGENLRSVLDCEGREVAAD